MDKKAYEQFVSIVNEETARALDKFPKGAREDAEFRFEHAREYLLGGHVEEMTGECAVTDGHERYACAVNEMTGGIGACTCTDYEQAPLNLCAHRIAIRLYRIVAARLEDRDVRADFPQQEATEPPEPDEKRPTTKPSVSYRHAEAPASANVFILLDGHKIQVTLRDEDEERLMERMRTLLAPFTALLPIPVEPPVAMTKAMQKVPVPMNEEDERFPGKTVISKEKATELWQEALGGAPTPVRPPRGAPPQAPTMSFAAESLESSMNKGRVYWKVKGGKFTKWGVSIWPEVLEKAGLVDLDAGRIYDVTGMQAEFTIKDDGQPEKVVKLSWK